MMCKRILLSVLILGLGNIAFAKVEAPLSCHICGMDRSAYAQSRMLVIYGDGTTVGTCSLNCAVIEMKQHPENKVKALMVGDYRTEKLLDARTATWVIGGKFPGVMTSVAKWAFDDHNVAYKFIAENGGTIATFDECLQLALHEN